MEKQKEDATTVKGVVHIRSRVEDNGKKQVIIFVKPTMGPYGPILHWRTYKAARYELLQLRKEEIAIDKQKRPNESK